jgi:hypothetical protein
MAAPSYAERMKAARADARARRQLEKLEYQRRIELAHEAFRLAKQAVVVDIRARGQKISLLKPSEWPELIAKILLWTVIMPTPQPGRRCFHPNAGVGAPQS